MQIFGKLYKRVIAWSRHRHAPYYLASMSFAEASFFPIPPDVMLAPMALATREKAWRFALIATLFSVLGGLFGYLIGHFFLSLVTPLLQKTGYWSEYLIVVSWFKQWGFWILFLAGFTPIPYKLFTIAGGAANMAIMPFIAASLLGRGGRFFLVAAAMYWGGPTMERLLERYIEQLGWILIILAVVGYVIWRFY